MFVAAIGLSADCVDSYSGTRLVANLTVSPGLDRAFLVVPSPGLAPGDPGFYSHYEMFARVGEGGWVRLRSFLIRPSFDPTNPCQQFVPEIYCVETSGHPCDPWMNPQRFASLSSILAVVSAPVTPASDGTPVGFSPGFDYASWPDALFVDPGVTVAASKLARDNLEPDAVRAFCDALPENQYVGNGPQLTLPQNGKIFGVVDGPDPRTGSTIGGISINVPGKLHDLTALLITRESDPSRLTAENRDRRDLAPGPDSQVFLIGERDGPFGSIDTDLYRGVTSVQMESPYSLPISMHVIVYEDIDEDPILF